MTRKILIADDDRDLGRLLAMSLRGAGYEVLIATGAAQAVELALKHQPDLYVLDMNMPAGGGLGIQQALESLPEVPPSPFIYLTGDKSEELLADARAKGAFRVLYKPVDTVQLLSTLRAALHQSATALAAR